jgi:hypothetical protein
MKSIFPEDSQQKTPSAADESGVAAHRQTSGQPNKSKLAAASVSTANVPRGPQFFTSEQRPAGVMWMRQSAEVVVPSSVPEQTAGSDIPVSSPEAVAPVAQPAEAGKNPVDGAAPAPYAEVDKHARVGQVQEPEWPGYGFEPPSKYQHPFWKESGVQPPSATENRDALPAIETPVVQEVQITEALEPEKPRAETPGKPSTGQAVNPNVSPIETEAAPEPRPVDQNAAAKPGFLGRRHAKAGLQSEAMEGAGKLGQNSEELLAGELTPAFESANSAEWENDFVPESAAAEAAPPELPEQAAQSEEVDHTAVFAEQKPTQTSFEHVMQQGELLELAKAIRIDGVSVSEMFTAGRIDEEGLRRIVVAYLRGGELRQLISQEIIRQQMKFERDPQLRGTPVNAATNTAGAKHATVRAKRHTKPLLNAGRALDRTERAAAFTQGQVEKAYEFLTENPKTVQMLSIVAIFVIYAAILVLILRR